MTPLRWFVLIIAATILASIGLMALAVHAQAQQPQSMCAPKAVIIDFITTGKYQEKPAYEMTGMADGSFPLTLYVGKESGTWTVVLTRPDGIACIVLAGFGWQRIPTGDPA